MPLETFRIKVNDSVTLKRSLEKYCINNSEGTKVPRAYLSKCPINPNYIINMVDARLFSGATVTVEGVEKRNVVINHKLGVIKEFHYIYVVDRLLHRACFPIQFINMNCTLLRDHHRIKLHKKTLTT